MRIGVRELRQNASRYLALVQQGEVVEVTTRGQIVARLVPAEGDVRQQLIAAGMLQPAERDLLEVDPCEPGYAVSEQLAALRADER